MTFELGHLFLVAVLYLSALFLIAYATDRGWIPQRLVHHPLVYALSLGVYATSWSYYGSVGLAQEQGFLFLAIYLGPTLAFLAAPILLRPILRVVKDYQLTSLADLFAFRFSSQLAGILVTVFVMAGTLPYIALQIRAVTESVRVLTQEASPDTLALVFCATLTVFAILFGARHLSPREKHKGLVVAIAFESLVKLGAILLIGMFAVTGVFGGTTGLNRWLAEHPEALTQLYQPLHEAPWATFLLLSFAAAFLLPRQFHMSFVENMDERALSVASWAFPLFLLLFNLAIPPILWAAQALATQTSPDYYLLGITLSGNSSLLPIVAFVGGISAASAMVIVTTLALSSMALNHLLLPLSYPDPSVDLYRWLAWGRRMIIGLIILTGYGFYLVLESSQGLVQIGLLSFVAVAQLLPGIVGVLFWPRATRHGFIAGLLAGGGVWYAALMMPVLGQSGITVTSFSLQEYLGALDQNRWEFATFWSLSLNTLLFVAVSLLTRPSKGEERAISACFGDAQVLAVAPAAGIASVEALGERLSHTIGAVAGREELTRALKDLAMDPGESTPAELQRLSGQVERNLSGMIGPMLARMIVDTRVEVDESTRSMLTDQFRFVEDQLERSRSRFRGLAQQLDGLRRYHRRILQDLPLGAASISADGEILTWNQAIAKLTDVPAKRAIGGKTAELPAPWGALIDGFIAGDRLHLYKHRINARDGPRCMNLHKAATASSPAASPEEAPSVWSGVVVLIEDLTSEQMLESELAHSERLASVGRLAAGVAHEIGNPVTGIACLAQNMQHETDPKQIEGSVDEILVQTARINEILQSLMTFSHSGMPGDLRWGSFRLVECVEDAKRLVQLGADGRRVRILNHADHELALVGDRQQILQVLVNLLRNACDESPPDAEIEVTAEQVSDRAVIAVRDQGPGVTDEMRERVFEPFFTTKEPGKGTGLGLHLAYNIVREHGGQIGIHNNSGGGACVTVRLPLERESALLPAEVG